MSLVWYNPRTNSFKTVISPTEDSLTFTLDIVGNVYIS